MSNLDQGLYHPQLASFAIDVTPTQAEKLPAAQARDCCQAEGEVEGVVLRRQQVLRQLLRCPNGKDRRLRCSRRGWIGEARRVPRQVPRPHGVTEGLVQDRVEVADS